MLIPTSTAEYKDYKNARGSMAIHLHSDAGNAAIPLSKQQKGRSFALHPACSGMAQLYEKDQLAFITNVGTLIEPTSIEAALRGTARLPDALFSHNNQREMWQTGITDLKSKSGWFGRTTDLLHEAEDSTSFSTNISLSGNNVMQTGKWSLPYSISQQGPPKSATPSLQRLIQETNANDMPQGLLEDIFGNTLSDAYSRNNKFAAAFTKHLIDDVEFPDTSLSHSLKAVATAIAARKELSQTRQTFFVIHPGWDTHQEQTDKHSELLKTLGDALLAFNNNMEKMGLSEVVTAFTMSDFGRTLRSNGRGTDHGWGGNCIVTGGAVRGGHIYGDYPETLLLGKGLDIGKNGRLLPGLSTDQYFAPLLHWYGLDNHQLHDILPNLRRFVDISDLSALPRYMNF